MDEKQEVGSDGFMEGKMTSNNFSSPDPRLMSSVEIIIPFYTLYHKVVSLVEAIFATVTSNRYQITLIDDGSPNHGFIKELASKKIDGLVCYRKNEHEGFGAAVNFALQNRKNDWIPYVCIMHSDVIPVGPAWLSNLGGTLKRMKGNGIKMVSARSNYFDENMSHLVTERSQKSDDYILNENEYLPMFCSLAHRDIFKHVGLFNNISLAGCESHEFASRMRDKGYKQAIAGSSWINHEGNGTTNNLSPKLKEILRKTRNEYYESINIKSSEINSID